MTNPSKRKGTSFEVLIRDFLAANWDDRIVRVAQAGSKDLGDLANFRIGKHKIAIECKNVAKMNLSGWVREAQDEAQNIGGMAGVVIHKRPRHGLPADQYVTMTLADFLMICGVDR